ncbi:MAG TPA: class I SAM-dependent methyltransferase [Acidimicrobiales bacterium]|nr:class I SAM-dependent methyltransferase [Acidimicrobiales bacterium]
MATNQAESQRWNDEHWTRVWPKRERLTGAVTGHLLSTLDLRPAERVLDVGCGGGKTTLHAAQAVGPDGYALGADFSAPLLRLAEQRAQASSQKNVAFHVADVQRASLPDGPFDVAMSQFGVMFFDEPVAAFANIGSHLRPGGRIAFACWQELERNPWFFAPVIAAFIPPPASPPPGKHATGPFALSDPARTARILSSAGYGEVERATYEIEVDVPTDAVVDDAQLSFMGVAPDRHEEAMAVVEQHMERFRLDDSTSRIPLAFQIFTASCCAEGPPGP